MLGENVSLEYATDPQWGTAGVGWQGLRKVSWSLAHEKDVNEVSRWDGTGIRVPAQTISTDSLARASLTTEIRYGELDDIWAALMGSPWRGLTIDLTFNGIFTPTATGFTIDNQGAFDWTNLLDAETLSPAVYLEGYGWYPVHPTAARTADVVEVINSGGSLAKPPDGLTRIIYSGTLIAGTTARSVSFAERYDDINRAYHWESFAGARLDILFRRGILLPAMQFIGLGLDTTRNPIFRTGTPVASPAVTTSPFTGPVSISAIFVGANQELVPYCVSSFRFSIDRSPIWRPRFNSTAQEPLFGEPVVEGEIDAEFDQQSIALFEDMAKDNELMFQIAAAGVDGGAYLFGIRAGKVRAAQVSVPGPRGLVRLRAQFFGQPTAESEYFQIDRYNGLTADIASVIAPPLEALTVNGGDPLTVDGGNQVEVNP